MEKASVNRIFINNRIIYVHMTNWYVNMTMKEIRIIE